MKKSKNFIYFILFFVIILFIFNFFYFRNFDFNVIFEFLKRNRNFASILYIFVMILAIVISPIPSMPLAIFSGYFFGTYLGFLYTIIGALIGSIIAFLIGRYFKDCIIKKIGTKINLFENISENKLMLSIFIMRLIPLFQFDIISYGAGMTRIRLYKFSLATLFGMIPVTFALVFWGDSFKFNLLYSIYFLVLIIVIYLIFNYLKHKQKVPQSSKIDHKK